MKINTLTIMQCQQKCAQIIAPQRELPNAENLKLAPK